MLVAAANTQTYTDTPDAFRTDLEAACDWATSLASIPENDARGLQVRAALSRQTKLGQLNLEYEFRLQNKQDVSSPRASLPI